MFDFGTDFDPSHPMRKCANLFIEVRSFRLVSGVAFLLLQIFTNIVYSKYEIYTRRFPMGTKIGSDEKRKRRRFGDGRRLQLPMFWVNAPWI